MWATLACACGVGGAPAHAVAPISTPAMTLAAPILVQDMWPSPILGGTPPRRSTWSDAYQDGALRPPTDRVVT